MTIKKTANSDIQLPIEVLNNPENWEIFNLPNMIKKAFVGKDSNIEGFDLKAEIKNHPEHLYIKIFAIKKDEVNDNGDAFSEEELKKAAHTFVGVPLFTNHQNDDIEKAKGDCIHSWYDDEKGGIYIIGKVDKVAYPKLARGIEEKYISATSMGTSVEGSCCSICHNYANTAEQYCSHISNRKNRKFSGNIECQYHNSKADTEEKCPLCGSTKDKKIKLSHENLQIFEHNYGLKFIENSFVVNPACHECGISEILHIPNVNKKIAQLKESINKISENTKNKNFKINDKLKKVAGQKEIDMLKDSMNGLEDVVKSMLQQKEQVSMEYVSDLVKAMSDVQEVVDELTEMGYTQLPSPVTSESPISDLTTSKQEISQPIPIQEKPKEIQTPTPSNISTEDLSGLGSITKPKFSEKNKKNKEDFLKISSNLKDNIEILKNIVHNNENKELKSMAKENTETKIAASDENQNIIQEKQLEKKNEKLHPRTEDTPISITESKEQIGGSQKIDDVTSESPQVRKGTYDTITEDQLRSTVLGDAVIQNKATPNVITENQWTDISRLVGAKIREDYTEVIGEGQIKDLLSNNKFVGTYETTTEDQLKNIPMDGTNRWANTEYVKSIVKIATNVVIDAITKYRKSPEELKKVMTAIDNDINIKNKIAYLSILNALPYKKEDRDNIAKNINYFKIASSLDPFDALTFSIANNSQHGIKVYDILDSVSHILNNKIAMAQVEEKIKINNDSNSTKIVSKASAFDNAIKELDKPEDGLYQIKGTFEDLGIKMAESNKEEIVNAINKYAQNAIEDTNTITLKIIIKPESGVFESTHKDEDMLEEGECPFAPENLDLGNEIEGPIEDIIDIGNNKKEETSPCLLSQKRENIVKEAQMLGGQMGGQGGMSQGPGAGASLPTPPGAMNDIPMQSLTNEPGAEEMGGEMEEDLEPLPPGTACPVCTSKDVDVVSGKSKCNNCGQEYVIKTTLELLSNENNNSAEEEGERIGEGEEVGEGEGFELPEEENIPAMALVTRLYPHALEKIASQNIKLGSVSPLTGNTNTYKMKNGEYICLDTASKYKVSYVIDKKDPNKIYAQWEWTPKITKKSNCPSCQKSKNEFIKSLASVNMTEEKFNELDISEKAKIILSMKKDGKLNKIANKNGSILQDYKVAFSGYGDKFPIESCMEKLARRYGENAIALSGPCEGSPLAECVCNNLKKAGVYTTGLAMKVADSWSNTCGSEECIEDQVRSGYTIREAATICESLKIVLATEEDMFADDLSNNNDIVETDETVVNETPLDNSIEDVDPFENIEENTVTVELPANVVEEIGKAIEVAQGKDTIGAEEIPVEEDTTSVGIEDAAGDVIEEGVVENVESPIEGEMKDMKEVGEVEGIEEVDPEKEALKEEIKEEIKEELKEELKEEKNNKGDLEDKGEEFKEGEGEFDNNQNLNPGNTEGESNEVNTASSEFNYDEASFMKSKMSKGGTMNLDLEAIANAIGFKKESTEKEIQHKNVQDVSEIGTYTAGENGSLIGHENETIETATIPSVPRNKALIGNEDSDLNPQGKPQPKIPMAPNGGTIGHEDEQDLAIGNNEYTGGNQGAGKAETTASVEDELMHMKGFGSTKESLGRLVNRMVEAAEKKLEAPEPVAKDKDIQPIQDNKTIGNEEKFDAETPSNVEGKGNESMIGHEKETLGDRPTSPKDLPSIPVDNQLMGQETSEIGPEKQTKEKGTVIAESNQESKVNNTKEAIRVAGRMLESKMITSNDLQTKIAELENYKPSQIRDLEKAMFSPKKGFGTVSEGISQPIIINEASNQRNSQDDLKEKLSSLFSLEKRNRLALENEDFNLKKSYGKI